MLTTTINLTSFLCEDEQFSVTHLPVYEAHIIQQTCSKFFTTPIMFSVHMLKLVLLRHNTVQQYYNHSFNIIQLNQRSPTNVETHNLH